MTANIWGLSKVNFFSDNVGLYFFSAVFQGNMALLALVGVFVVFKIQQITSDLQSKDASIINYVQYSFGVIVQQGRNLPPIPISYRSVGDLPRALKELSVNSSKDETIRNQASSILDDKNFLERIEERNYIEKQPENVIRHMKCPFIMTFIVIILSLIFLSLVYYFHNIFPYLEILSISLVIFLNIIALVLIVQFVFKVVRHWPEPQIVISKSISAVAETGKEHKISQK